MTCNACLEAVKRSLNKSLGSRIISIEGNLEEQVRRSLDASKRKVKAMLLILNGVCLCRTPSSPSLCQSCNLSLPACDGSFFVPAFSRLERIPSDALQNR